MLDEAGDEVGELAGEGGELVDDDEEPGDLRHGGVAVGDVCVVLEVFCTDLGERVLRTGGEVVIVPAERMPTQTGAAAIYRF